MTILFIYCFQNTSEWAKEVGARKKLCVMKQCLLQPILSLN